MMSRSAAAAAAGVYLLCVLVFVLTRDGLSGDGAGSVETGVLCCGVVCGQSLCPAAR